MVGFTCDKIMYMYIYVYIYICIFLHMHHSRILYAFVQPLDLLCIRHEGDG